MNERIHIGTSGWHHEGWRGLFYPKDLPKEEWLQFYQERFDTVEINNAFHQQLSASMLERWHDEVSDSFLFAIKAHRYITHQKKLRDPKEPLQKFLAQLEPLGGKRGPILFQLPPNWQPNVARLEDFARLLSDELKRQTAIEFRDERWHSEEILQLLERYGVSHCIFHAPELASPLRLTDSIVYVRLHGSEDWYRGSYHGNALAAWARRLVDWAKQGKEVYCYFNNDQEAAAPEDARRLQEYVAKFV